LRANRQSPIANRQSLSIFLSYLSLPPSAFQKFNLSVIYDWTIAERLTCKEVNLYLVHSCGMKVKWLNIGRRHSVHRDYLDWMSVRCPRCNRFVMSWPWLFTATIVTSVSAIALMKLMDVIFRGLN